ncbi:MAG: 5'-flap endonuclease [Piccolia ochrophora]|nr:MAG: 5'-flap endonuclease [Piccolia ochrophora]
MATATILVLSSPSSVSQRRGISSSPKLPSPSSVLHVPKKSRPMIEPQLSHVPSNLQSLATPLPTTSGPREPPMMDYEESTVPAASSVAPCHREISGSGKENIGVGKEKKTRSKGTETQTRIRNRKVIKSTVDRDAKAKPKRSSKSKKEQPEQVLEDSAQFRVNIGDGAARTEGAEVLGLDLAVPRKVNWTPTKASLHSEHPKDTGSACVVIEDSGDEPEDGCLGGFEDLIGKFGFKVGDRTNKPMMAKLVPPKKTTSIKRRKSLSRMETSRPSNDPSNAATPPAPPKKRPKTITEQATAAFVLERPQSPPTALLQYVTKGLAAECTDAQPPMPGSGLERSKATVRGENVKGGTKAKPARRRTKKNTEPQSTLLCPPAALEKLNDQDVLFGTSSQLASEESPTFIRNLQQAMKASGNAHDDLGFNTSFDNSIRTSSGTSMASSSTSMFIATRSLWSAAARNGDGSLMETEVVDLANSPDECAITRPSQPVALGDGQHGQHGAEEEPSIIVIDEMNVAKSLELPSPSRLQQAAQSSKRSNKKPSPTNSSHSIPTAVDMHVPSAEMDPKPSLLARTPAQSTNDFTGIPTPRLAKELASYGFKSIKGRKKMIELLEKCRQSKAASRKRPGSSDSHPTHRTDSAQIDATRQSPHPTARADSPPSHAQSNLDDVVPPPLKKPRGRPKKPPPATTAPAPPAQPNPPRTTAPRSSAALLTTTPRKRRKPPVIEEISDSDTAPTPSPPRRSPHARLVPSPPLQLSSSNSRTTPEPSPSSLSSRITAAVKAQPRGTDSRHPSWHEKMLLYDPIVLEDLAAWLNTDGLKRVGVDDEVGPAEVRAWCERRSVCCLWRENTRGKERRRL